jgi:hypothetical protein
VPFLKNRLETRINKGFPAVGFWGLTPIKNKDSDWRLIQNYFLAFLFL